MTREETAEAIKVMQAYVDGADVEFTRNGQGWDAAANPAWDWAEFNFRIKPKPKIEVGKWYEVEGNRVLRCLETTPKMFNLGGLLYRRESILREVRVEAVNET
jgi:hypothetical protein